MLPKEDFLSFSMITHWKDRKAVSSQYSATTSGRLVSESQPAGDSLAMQKQDIHTFGERESETVPVQPSRSLMLSG